MQLYKVYSIFILPLLGGAISGDIAETLLERYNNLVDKCVDSDKSPKSAHECSGIVIRGTRNGANAWNLRPIDKHKNSVSYTFLRRDQFFDRFPHYYVSGYILYPQLSTPKQKNRYTMYCAFPLDAGTGARHINNGCGLFCDDLGVTSFKDWIKIYGNGSHGEDHCAFDMTKPKIAAKNFKIVSEASQYIRNNYPPHSPSNGEMLLPLWNDQEPAKLPIQAFFYLISSDNGYSEAYSYQQQYHRLTLETIPIVGISLPQTNEGKIMFVMGKKEKCVCRVQ